MNIKEIADLIAIRQYTRNAIEFPSTDRKLISILGNVTTLIDKKIIKMVTSAEFKDLISYKEVDEAIDEITAVTNITTVKSSMRSGSVKK